MKRLSRRSFLAGSAATALTLGLAACSDDADTPADSVSSSNDLRILNWDSYIDPTLIPTVADSLRMRIEYSSTWEDNYSGQDRFGPQWDIVTPTNWLAAQYIQAGEVERLPLELIPNHVNIDPVYLTNNWDRGARFHMPWQAGITGIAYDPELTGRELDSIEDLFADDLRGRVAMIGEMREAVGLAMLAAGDDPARGQFHSFVFSEFADLLKEGTVAASMAWSGDAVQLQAERPDLKFVIPKEGAIQWFDTMIIPKGAGNARGAALWMNRFYSPEIAATNTLEVQYISPVLGVRDELRSLGSRGAAVANNEILFPDDETQRRLFIWGGLDSASEEAALDDRFAALLE